MRILDVVILNQSTIYLVSITNHSPPLPISVNAQTPMVKAQPDKVELNNLKKNSSCVATNLDFAMCLSCFFSIICHGLYCVEKTGPGIL